MTIHYVFQSYVTQEQKALCQAYFEHVINPKEDSAKAIAKLCDLCCQQRRKTFGRFHQAA